MARPNVQTIDHWPVVDDQCDKKQAEDRQDSDDYISDDYQCFLHFAYVPLNKEYHILQAQSTKQLIYSA